MKHLQGTEDRQHQVSEIATKSFLILYRLRNGHYAVVEDRDRHKYIVKIVHSFRKQVMIQMIELDDRRFRDPPYHMYLMLSPKTCFQNNVSGISKIVFFDQNEIILPFFHGQYFEMVESTSLACHYRGSIHLWS